MSTAAELAPPTWAEPAYLDPTTGRLVTPAAPVADALSLVHESLLAFVPARKNALRLPRDCVRGRTITLEGVPCSLFNGPLRASGRAEQWFLGLRRVLRAPCTLSPVRCDVTL